MSKKKVLVVGAGWSGATVANILFENNIAVNMIELENVIGGHSRSDTINGVLWEPYGAHIFHTSDVAIAKYVNKFGLNRNYEHKVLTEILDKNEKKLLSWPPQIDELKDLHNWKTIKYELNNLPKKPVGDKFVDYIVSMMGRTLYEIFIEGYSIKQWGENLSNLSSSFAPKRIELRDDGYKRLFRDKFEYFSSNGVTPIIKNMLKNIPIEFNKEVDADFLTKVIKNYDFIVLTCPLDSFLKKDSLKWRGITLKPEYFELKNVDQKLTAAYVINYPSLEVPYVRTIETKHASGQKINGTVVAKEYTGSSEKHYPIITSDNYYEALNTKLKNEIVSEFGDKIYFAGRLANYEYINQDEAISQGFKIAKSIIQESN